MKLLERYQKDLKAKRLKADAAQLSAVRYLGNVQKALNNKTAQELRGVYMYGSVGRGKSMLVDMFCADLTVMYRRVHFHAFMEELHERLHKLDIPTDPIAKIAHELACEARVLCFDEFYITNIADAMLLGRLFEHLFINNVLVITTSNWAMDDLFQGGVNRAQFMKFVRLMEKQMDVIHLGDGIDHRSHGMKTLPHYLPIDHYGNTDKQLSTYFNQFKKVGTAPEFPENLEPKKAGFNIAWYSFNYLCGAHNGREDYLHLAKLIDTVIIENIPIFSSADADAALRFITLVDILYENKVRLICSAAAETTKLCPTGDAAEPFLRTASRIHEMQAW